MSEIPRRNRIDQFTPAEKAIYDAAQAVESMPADVRLTDAVILLGAARDSVADFIDGVTIRRSVAATTGENEPLTNQLAPAADSAATRWQKENELREVARTHCANKQLDEDGRHSASCRGCSSIAGLVAAFERGVKHGFVLGVSSALLDKEQ